MKRRLLCAAMLAVSLAIPGVAAAQPSKPNIVLVLMDNFGYGELGVYGGGVLRGAPTPRIDKLASEGMRLLNFNVEAQCTPSRVGHSDRALLDPLRHARCRSTAPLYGLDAVGGHHRRGAVRRRATPPGISASGTSVTRRAGFRTDQGFDEWYGIPHSTDESFWPRQPAVDRRRSVRSRCRT